MEKSSVFPKPRVAHIMGGPSTPSVLMLMVVGGRGMAGTGVAAAAAAFVALIRLEYSAAKPRKISPASSTAMAKMRADGLVAKSETSIASIIRNVMNMIDRSHVTNPSFRSVLQAPRLV